MPTKIYVEVEVDMDVNPAALAEWVSESLNFAPDTAPVISEDDQDLLDSYVGPVLVTKFEPIISELCESVASSYPPAAEEPQDAVELYGHGHDKASRDRNVSQDEGDFFGPDGFANVGYCPAELHHAAIEAWGVEANVRRLAEECGELVAAMNRFLDGRRGAMAVASEVADVLIMVERVPQFIAAILRAEGSSVTALDFAEWVQVEAKGKVLNLRDRIDEARGAARP